MNKKHLTKFNTFKLRISGNHCNIKVIYEIPTLSSSVVLTALLAFRGPGWTTRDVLRPPLPQRGRRSPTRTFSASFYGLRRKGWMNREFSYKEIQTETLLLGWRAVCKAMLCWNLRTQEENKPLVRVGAFLKERCEERHLSFPWEEEVTACTALRLRGRRTPWRVSCRVMNMDTHVLCGCGWEGASVILPGTVLQLLSPGPRCVK